MPQTTTVIIVLHLCAIVLSLNSNFINKLQIGPFNLKKLIVEESFSNSYDDDNNTFSILSWNVLAQSLARSEMHPHVEKGMLKEKLRIPLLVEILKNYNSDIMCLQEVDMLNTLDDLLLKVKGYEYIYVQKTSGKKDGCLICYKTKKFLLERYITVKYGITLMDGVGIICSLKALNSTNNKSLILGNTHLFWKPNHESVRLRQLQLFVKQIDKFKEENSDNDDSVIIVGDMNSKPDASVTKVLLGENVPLPLCKTPIGGKTRFGADLMLEEIEKNSMMKKQQEDGNNNINNEIVSLSNNLKGLRSVFGIYKKLCPEDQLNDSGDQQVSLHPSFTTYSYGFAGCIDWMFCSTNLKTTALWQLPNEKECKIHIALPNSHFPSDHLPLCAKLKFK